MRAESNAYALDSTFLDCKFYSILYLPKTFLTLYYNILTLLLFYSYYIILTLIYLSFFLTSKYHLNI